MKLILNEQDFNRHWSIEPFFLLPLQSSCTDADTYLMKHDSVFAKNDCPVNPRKEWIPFAMTNPALLHATCSYSAWSLAALQGKPVTLEMMYHKAESIRLLNESLRNLNDCVPSDSTIAAVASLKILEVLIQRYLPLLPDQCVARAYRQMHLSLKSTWMAWRP